MGKKMKYGPGDAKENDKKWREIQEFGLYLCPI